LPDLLRDGRTRFPTLPGLSSVVAAARVQGLAWEAPAPFLRREKFADRLLARRA
jgi:hypothetical protein